MTQTHNAGFNFVLVPDDSFNQQYIKQLAPNADMYILQGENLEANIPQFKIDMESWIQTIRQGNSHAQIFIQVSTNKGNSQQMKQALQSITQQINGIAAWTSPDTLSVLQQFVAVVRQ